MRKLSRPIAVTPLATLAPLLQWKESNSKKIFAIFWDKDNACGYASLQFSAGFNVLDFSLPELKHFNPLPIAM